jgi:NAD(P)-dependent dehydrogenase (short-subunit alcohol dehydrogenase family)
MQLAHQTCDKQCSLPRLGHPRPLRAARRGYIRDLALPRLPLFAAIICGTDCQQGLSLGRIRSTGFSPANSGARCLCGRLDRLDSRSSRAGIRLNESIFTVWFGRNPWRGAHVAFLARTSRAVQLIADETGAFGIVADVGRKDDIYPAALQITGNLGGLDVLINNASSLGPTPLVPLADTQCEELQQALAVNLLGPFRLTKTLLGALAASAREGRGAVVVNVSSDAAVNPYPGWGAYGASKVARHLTEIWAEEGRADGISFLSIDPGDMDTPLHALAVPDADPMTLRWPEECAAQIVETMLSALPGLATVSSEGIYDCRGPPRSAIS